MRRCWLLLLLAMPACDDGGPATSPELLFELRQLRGSVEQLAQRPTAPVELDKALVPLQEVMQTLAQDQQDLRTRQLALTGELQRWTQLLAEGANAPKGDTAELQARLQKLEQELQAQNQRHQEVQELLRQALEKTSDRLEGFLQKLQTVQPDKAPAEADMPKDRGDKGQTAAVDASWLQPGYQLGGRARAEPWTIALLASAVVMVAAFAWRYWRAGEVRRAAAVPLEEAGNNTDELWAAAALLSEAVGRLKAVAPAGSAVPEAVDLSDLLRQLSLPAVAEAAAPAADDLDDGVFVLEDDIEVPEVPEVPVAAVRSEAPAAAPPWHEVALDCRRPELVAGVVEAALCGDPRVLRRPAPQVQRHGDRVLVRYCLLPDLGDAEAAQFRQLLQRLAGS